MQNNIIYTRARAWRHQACAWRRHQGSWSRLAPPRLRLAPAAEATAPGACRPAPGALRCPPKALTRARPAPAICCLLSPHQGTSASCNNIIFKAISNNINIL
ncbi:hypothetical protein QL285_057462 [Trifolium repens]|nr:hypothetical protein QL285_057462 [Trifolium repens]